MNKEFFEAVRELEKEKGIPAEYLYEKSGRRLWLP